MLRRAWRRRPPDTRGADPRIGPADRLFRDLPELLPEAFRPAPALTRELLMEEALLAGVSEPGVPRGDPAALADPFLAFLDEQSGDREIAPERSAFEAFAGRASRELAEAAGLEPDSPVTAPDDGAARLLALTRWLRGAEARYRAALAEAGRADPDDLRRKLLERAESFRPRLRRTRVLALGEEALRPADCQLLAALLPRGNLVWALPEKAALPKLPDGIHVRDIRSETPAAVPAPAWAPRRTLFSAPPGSGAAVGAAASAPRRPRLHAPAGQRGPLFHTTDREDEPELAAALLRRFREEEGSRFGGWDRCALAAADPRTYLEAAEAAFEAGGIPLESRLEPRLSNEPWVAAIAGVLDFACRPGRLSSGLSLLRGPFFADARLPDDPPRLADRLADRAARCRFRNTRAPERMPELADGFREEAAKRRRKAAWCEENRKGDPDRHRRRARAFDDAALAAGRLAGYAKALAPLRDPKARFADALEALRRFLHEHLPPPGDPVGARAAAAADQVLEQAAAAVPGSARVGDSDRSARRVRRLLNRRGAARPAGSARADEGVHLVAAADLPYGDYDLIVLLGVVDADWPGPRPGNIFFPRRLLEEATKARHAARRAAEVRLLRTVPGLPRKAVAFSRSRLDDGFPAGVSPFEIELAAAIGEMDPPRTELEEEHLRHGPKDTAAAEAAEHPPDPLPRALDRSAPSAAGLLDRPLSPTAMDGYHRNPAQFFAGYVLGLGEENEPGDLMPPVERGTLLHDFLESAYRSLEDAGIRVSEAALDEVLARFRAEFRRFAKERGLDRADRRNEERWLFGGEGIPGALEWFLREEAVRGPGRPIAFEKWIEAEIEPAAGNAPALRVHGKVDRLDELPEGTRRVVEYKSGRFYAKPLQPRLYARILESRGGPPVEYAVPYFGGREWIGPEDRPKPEEQDEAIAAVRDGIAAGEFPAREEGLFDFPLVLRADLPDAPRGPDPDRAGPVPETPPPAGRAAK